MTSLASDVQNVFAAAAIFLDVVAEYCSDKFAQGEGLSCLENGIAARRATLKLLPPTDPLRSYPSVNLAFCLSTRHGLLGNIADLDEAILIHRGVLALLQSDHHLRPLSMKNIACCLCTRFDQLGKMDDLQEAITINRNALELCPLDNFHRPMLLNNMATCLHTRYGKLGATSDLDEAATLLRHALELRPVGHPDRSVALSNLASYLFTLYNRVGGINNLEEAISMHRDALELRPVSHPDRSISLYNLALCLSTRYSQQGAICDLDDAITMHNATLELRPQGHPGRPLSLNCLGICLDLRFSKLGMIDDLEEAIKIHRGVLNLCSPGHHLHIPSMTNLGVYLSYRYHKLGSMSDLEEAVVLHRSVLEFYSPGNPLRFTPLHNLAHCLFTRYEKLGSMDDLQDAITMLRDSLELVQLNNPRRPMLLNNLADSLFSRYNQLGMMNDLEEAISVHREVLESPLLGKPFLPSSMNNLGLCLSARYRLLGDANDLEESIAIHRGALSLRPPGHPDRSSSLNNLAVSLVTRYSHHGSPTDFEEAVARCQEALELHPVGHPYRPKSLDNLGYCFRQRYKLLRVSDDMETALMIHREALDLRPPGNPDQSFSLDCINACLVDRYYRLRAMSDLEEAIMVQRRSLELRPEGHPSRFLSLHNLAFSLAVRFEELGEADDLEDALGMYRHALRLQFPSQAVRCEVSTALAHCLTLRYSKFGDMNDITEAIAISRDALGHCADDHPYRTASLHALATGLLSQAAQPEGQEEAFDLYSQLSSNRITVSKADLEGAKAWVDVAEQYGHHSTVLAYRTLLSFLVHHLTILPSLPQNLDVFKEFTFSLAVDAFSACVRHNQLTDAVELVEQGRSVFWTQRLRLRSPLDDLAESAGDTGKRLGEKFIQLNSLLRNVLDSPSIALPTSNSNLVSQHDQAWHLNVQLQDTVENIRKLPGQSRFLLPLLFSDVRKAAAKGPVIIVNASKYSCDALVVLFESDPIHIPLQITKTRAHELSTKLYSLVSDVKTKNVTNDLAVILRELWEDIVLPIVTVLEPLYPHRSRIWWCPTAEFAVLPLHAAGEYRKGKSNLNSLYISSYTPTLTALIRARQEGPSGSSLEPPTFLAIGQAKAVGHAELVSVNGELTHITERVATLATLTTIEGEDASVPKVIEALNDTQYVHVACHGLPNPEFPFKSGFALHDGRLRIEDIMRCDLRQARFAYLSACHTTVGDREGLDEVIHLAGAMHFAGFRSVVGTMWAMEDRVAEGVTSLFYGDMVDEHGRLDHTRAAYALNRTMRRVPGIELDQRIMLVHIGA